MKWYHRYAQTEANDDSKTALYKVFSILKRDSYGCDRMVVRFTTTLPVHSVPITTKVVSWNHADGKVYSIQHLCDKVCQ